MHAQSLSCVHLFATPWTIAHQAPLFMGFSKQGYWNGLPFPSPQDLPNLGIKSHTLGSATLVARFFTNEPPGKKSPQECHIKGTNSHKVILYITLKLWPQTSL